VHAEGWREADARRRPLVEWLERAKINPCSARCRKAEARDGEDAAPPESSGSRFGLFRHVRRVLQRCAAGACTIVMK
jgi:hypothetical protein